MKIIKTVLTFICFNLLIIDLNWAQINPNAIYDPNIHTVRFTMYGDQLSMPVYKLNSGDKLSLDFDDMDQSVKSYYYSYQLCDYDWQPVSLSAFDFLKGFTQMRINNYSFSSIAYTRYTHYQAILPEANSLPTKSGNYLLKVFLDGDTAKTVFTRALLVLDTKANVAAQMVQPFSADFSNTHQRLKFIVNLMGVNSFNANQDVKIRVLQNYRWDNAQGNIPPSFIRNNSLEYNTEDNFVFPGGKEWRWLDLRSLKLWSERVDSAQEKNNHIDFFLKPDIDRSSQRYIYYPDQDGLYTSVTTETINPFTQGDYANIHFCFSPPDHTAYQGKELYLIGQLTDYQLNNSSKMVFNEANGRYEGTQYLKQGYYNYGYLLVDKADPSQRTELEGNYWETENIYTILVYFKSFTDQSDQLIGVSKINTRIDRPGYSF